MPGQSVFARDMGRENVGRVKYMCLCMKCSFNSQLRIMRALLLQVVNCITYAAPTFTVHIAVKAY